MAKKTGLGRGIDAVFEDNVIKTDKPTINLKITDIEPRKNQPRKKFDTESLSELAKSISANGLIQPIVVRKQNNGYYGIIAGERRWRACKMAGLNEIPVVILEVDDKKASELALIENIQREDLTPIEEAKAYKALMEDCSLTQEETAVRVGKSRPAIANSMRLLELPEKIMVFLEDGSLSPGHARSLLGLKKKSDISKVAEIIIDKELNVRQAEDLVKKYNNLIAKGDKTTAEIKINYNKELEKAMTKNLGRKVKITNTPKSKKLILSFKDNDDLNELVETLCGKNILD